MRKKRQTEITDVKEAVKKSGLRHIAFIMDGNGRWARKRGMPREFGHIAGCNVMKKIVRYCRDIGIGTYTIYAFSTENIKRPAHEVEAIFKLLVKTVAEARDEENVEFRFIGNIDALGESIAERCHELERESTGGNVRLNIAFNYGGRDEIVRAVNGLIAEGRGSITEQDISASLDTGDSPDPDMIIRTGNELRLSNFLLWQSAYSELYFSDKMWPDFGPEDVDKAVFEFASRSRRWGGVDETEA
ncbi:MAG: di-trans,poly-cis-decaprenylcistransferase [Clostridia bacterium]|nr:di-trans,poly-cis-decaprenylcistransferase [Clostridia bacterium]